MSITQNAFKRLGYSLKALMKHRAGLQHSVHEGVDSIFNINLQYLKEQGIRGLILDFDGVLSPHGWDAPLPEAEQWLRDLTGQYGFEWAILSNNPSLRRQQYFAQSFPGTPVISGVLKKPYPEGIFQSALKLGCLPQETVMVDDRLMTGCLAAHVAGAHALWIRRPWIRVWSRHGLQEIYFFCLRCLDRLLLI